eukprot:4270205-Pyramimonas_sp.AAC.1
MSISEIAIGARARGDPRKYARRTTMRSETATRRSIEMFRSQPKQTTRLIPEPSRCQVIL